MDKELDSKIFFINDYTSKNNMEEHIKEYIRKLNIDHPNAIITKEFYRGKNILVRATEIKNNNTEKEKENQKEKEIVDWHIRQRGER